MDSFPSPWAFMAHKLDQGHQLYASSLHKRTDCCGWDGADPAWEVDQAPTERGALQLPAASSSGGCR